jgi:tripartite-type tricarboxylate transporter receptor subunit TctC
MWKLKNIAPLPCAAVALLFTATLAVAQTAANYPNKVVRVIVPYSPGGGTSAVMHIFADRLTRDMGHNFIVDNKPGGNTVIGSEAMARSAPDGHTLLLVTNTHVITPWFQPNLPYDTLRDFIGVSTMVRNDHMLATHPSFPANTLKELIAYARKNGDKINAAVTGLGTVNHLGTVLFMQATGTKFTIVPYKGGGTAITDMLSGAVQISINTVTTFAPHIRTGKLRGIAISGDKRNPVVADVPTFTEGGMKGFIAANWYALLAPSATPRDILQKLNEKVAQAQASPDVVALLAKQGVEVFPGNLAQTEAMIRSDLERIGKVIKENNIKAEAE